MRYILLICLFLIPIKTYAECPTNNQIQQHLKEITERLANSSSKPIIIQSVPYRVEHSVDGKAVNDLLAGNFKGYYLDRYNEVTEGTCVYRLRDDRTPTRGSFVLIRLD